jgi:hypothetical protein
MGVPAWLHSLGRLRLHQPHRHPPTGALRVPNYNFSNKSTDIVDLFLAACNLAGVEYRATFNPKRELWQVRVNRRESVARLVEHVGLKQ